MKYQRPGATAETRTIAKLSRELEEVTAHRDRLEDEQMAEAKRRCATDAKMARMAEAEVRNLALASQLAVMTNEMAALRRELADLKDARRGAVEVWSEMTNRVDGELSQLGYKLRDVIATARNKGRV